MTNFFRDEEDIRRAMGDLYNMGVSSEEYAQYIIAVNERLSRRLKPVEPKKEDTDD